MTRVAVIGGGAVGSACALFLRRLDATIDVTVVEPDPTLAQASSARSAASIRQQFSNELNVRLSQFGLQLLREPDAWLAVDGEPVDLGFVESGYLMLATSGAGAQVLRDSHAVQRAAGAPVVLLDAAATAARLPWLHCDDVALASLGEGGEGWFDGQLFARALARKARALGARWRRARAIGFERQGDLIAAVQLDDGHRLGADAIVLATGAWSQAVGALAGLEVPVVGRRRTVFVFNCPTPLPRTPLVADPSGVWFRSEGSGFIGGWTPGDGDADPDNPPLDQPDLAQFDERVCPRSRTVCRPSRRCGAPARGTAGTRCTRSTTTHWWVRTRIARTCCLPAASRATACSMRLASAGASPSTSSTARGARWISRRCRRSAS